MAKFKVGDRVYYRNDVNDTGTIVEIAGPDLWWVMWDKTQVRLSAYKHNLNLIEEKNVKFKVGDRVRYSRGEATGTIVEYKNRAFCQFFVEWDAVNMYGSWLDEDDLVLVQESNVQIATNQPTESKDTIDTYTVAEFKKLLDKMDDNLILQMANLRILFNRVPK